MSEPEGGYRIKDLGLSETSGLASESTAPIRRLLAKSFGEAFASKATDAFCLTIALPGSVSMEVAARRPDAVIRLALPDFRDLTEAVGSRWTLTHSGLIAPEAAEVVRQREVIRPTAVQRARHAALAVAEDIRSQLGTSTPATVLESQTEEADYCWLSGTVRARGSLSSIASIAQDERVKRIDAARKLEPELDVTLGTVGIPAFSRRHGVTGRGVIVAVLDSEIADLTELRGRVLKRENFTSEPWGRPGDHGTVVAAIIGGSGTHPGVAPDVTIYGYKVLATEYWRYGDDFQGALAIQTALEDGCHVANCSWGAGTVSADKSQIAIACDNAWALGMVVVKSAGNNGPGAGTVTRPGEADILVVGATNRRGSDVADYSSRGPHVVDGATIERPHLVAPGGDAADDMNAYQPNGDFGAVGHGTSYAAPHVAGLAALMLSRSPELTPNQVRDAILADCRSLGATQSAEGRGLMAPR